MNKKDIKCRIFEDEISTWVQDLNTNINRKVEKTIVINKIII
jgi:hypothetical protein